MFSSAGQSTNELMSRWGVCLFIHNSQKSLLLLRYNNNLHTMISRVFTQIVLKVKVTFVILLTFMGFLLWWIVIQMVC